VVSKERFPPSLPPPPPPPHPQQQSDEGFENGIEMTVL
jgi:hypothetical protein